MDADEKAPKVETPDGVEIRVQELRRAFSGKYTVTLISGKQVTLSRSHRQQLSALKGPS